MAKLNGKALAAAIAAASAIAAPLIMRSEGEAPKAYADRLASTRVPTICFGHTGPDVQLGMRATHSRCAFLLAEDQRRSAQGVFACTPRLAENIPAYAAVIDFTHNLGVRAYCRSSAAQRFAVGDFANGCRLLGRYIYAGGHVRPGLVTRRRRDVSLCLTGVWQ